MKLWQKLSGNPKLYGGSLEDDFTLSTGLVPFDFLNGEIILKDDGTRQLYTGISAGRIIQIIGKSGTGKSTLAAQIGINIIQRYENGLMYWFDFEQSTTVDRIRKVTGISEKYAKEHLSIQRKGITTEKVLLTLSKLKEMKLAHEKELLVPNENGIKDEAGKVINILPPTVVVVDSLAMMMPEDNAETEEIQGAMSATGIARVNAQFFKKAVQIANTANIVLIFINHITQNISIGATPVASVLNYLKQDEALSGGKAALYVTDTLIKLTAAAKLEPEKTYGVKGFEVKTEICKSRHAPAGRSVTLIFDQVNGFRNDLSVLEYIKSNDGLKGNGMAYYVEGGENYKFKLSNFAEKYATIPELRVLIDETAKAMLYSSIKESKNIQYFSAEELPEEMTENEEESTNE